MHKLTVQKQQHKKPIIQKAKKIFKSKFKSNKTSFEIFFKILQTNQLLSRQMKISFVSVCVCVCVCLCVCLCLCLCVYFACYSFRFVVFNFVFFWFFVF